MPIILVSAGLVIFWLLAIFSVSIHESFTLTLDLIKQGLLDGEPSNYFYFGRQIRNLIVALLMWWFVYLLPIKLLKNHKLIIGLFIAIVIFQLAVFLPEPIGATFNGARGWVRIAWSFTLQPSEFFKIGYVLFLSWWFIRKQNKINTKEFFISFSILHIILLFVFLIIPDLWTVLVLWVTGVIMCRYSGARLRSMLILCTIGAASALFVWLIASLTTSKFSYIQARLAYFVWTAQDEQNRWIWWQNEQALIAIWWGGFWWNWYGKWLQKLGWIPEAQSDFIFSAFSEEIGFIGNLILFTLYFLLAYFCIIKIPQVQSFHLKLIAIWLLSLIIMQTFINLWVNLKLLPNTWLTLPFVSFWWTALMVNVVEIIILYKILYKSE